eukprot:gene27545-36244_t
MNQANILEKCEHVDTFKIIEKEIRERISKEFYKVRRTLNKKMRKRQLLSKDDTYSRIEARVSAREPLEYKSFSLSDVIDPRNVIANSSFDSANIRGPIHYCESSSMHPLISKDVVIYEITTPFLNGLYLFQNALQPHAQIKLAKLAVEEYSIAEHTNLTNLKRLEEESAFIQSDPLSKSEPRSEDSNDLNESLWLRSVEENNGFRSFFKLRWSSLGYHYDWTERKYRKNLKSEFPRDLATLCKALASMVLNPPCKCKERDGNGLSSSSSSSSEERPSCCGRPFEYEPEAAIVNYYPCALGTCMGGHKDDAEHTMEKPIVSLNIGCSAIFLIGGRSKEDKPVPILVRSGDVLIMSGESRYCFHGVPCILPHTFQYGGSIEGDDDDGDASLPTPWPRLHQRRRRDHSYQIC